MCLQGVLLFNIWSNHMSTMRCFIFSNWNNPLKIIHFCFNDPISRILSTALDSAIDLARYYSHAVSLSVRKQTYYFPYDGSLIFFGWLLFPNLFGSWKLKKWTLPVIFSLSWSTLVLLVHLLGFENDCDYSSFLKKVSNPLFLVGSE